MPSFQKNEDNDVGKTRNLVTSFCKKTKQGQLSMYKQ